MRKTTSLNDNWMLTFPMGERASELVNLPHTWNAVDGMDGLKGNYLRTIGVYTRTFVQPKQPLPGGRTYVEVGAAGLAAVIKVNGQEVTAHEGGFSIFRADVTDFCHEGENELSIEVDNQDRSTMYPGAADFTFFGGLYRDVKLISVPDSHFDLDYYGGPGIMVTPKPMEDGGALFTLKAFVTKPAEMFTVLYSVKDASGKEVASACRPSDNTEVNVYVPDAYLWDMDNPYLYTVDAILQKNNESYDEISTKVGVRSFTVTPDDGFSINGVPTPLRGVSRHQDYLYKGNALTKEDHYEDARLIKEIGANTIRLAHYQHSQDFYDACDEMGFAVWAEIPFISVYKDNDVARANCLNQMRELVVQNYNHPSVMFWGLSNEILIGGISQQLLDDHYDLEKLVKELDQTRLTAIAHLTTTPSDSPMHGIADLDSYNNYFGWYGGKMEDNGPWLDKFHAEHPNLCIGISEYGAEGIVNWHSCNPECEDYSEDYQAVYHEHMAQVFEDRPWVWATHVWNMFDFASAGRNEGGVKARNNKGLVTLDRKTKKESFYVYQAYWSKMPMVHITGRRYAQRAGDTVEIKVYSNQPTVDLYLNGEKVGSQSAHRIFRFTVALKEGWNMLLAVAGEAKDSITLEKVEKEPSSYTLPEYTERKKGIANWFEQLGPLDLKSELEFPEGYFNIKVLMEEIAQNEEALNLVLKAVKVAANKELGPSSAAWNMVRRTTPEGVFNIVKPGEFGNSVLSGLNSQLNRIKR